MVYFIDVAHVGYAEAQEECSTSSEDDSESYRETGSSDSESDVSIDDIITDLGGGLSLMEKYPVLLNEAPPGSNARGAALTILILQLLLPCAAHVPVFAKTFKLDSNVRNSVSTSPHQR